MLLSARLLAFRGASPTAGLADLRGAVKALSEGAGFWFPPPISFRPFVSKASATRQQQNSETPPCHLSSAQRVVPRGSASVSVSARGFTLRGIVFLCRPGTVVAVAATEARSCAGKWPLDKSLTASRRIREGRKGC